MSIQLPNSGAIGFINQTNDVTIPDVSFDFPAGGVSCPVTNEPGVDMSFNFPPTASQAGSHAALSGREAADQHPMSAITGLADFVASMVFKTINGETILGTGNIVITGGGSSDHASLTNREIVDQHPIAAITGLQAALDSKAASVHGHDTAAIAGLDSALNSLSTSLAGKAPTSHGHAIADVTGLQAALDAAGGGPHVHDIADVTGLQLILDDKSNVGHTHVIGNVSGLQTALDGKADTGHGHVIADVSGLQTALNGKAATTHNHAIADVTGLQTALDGKSATGHTHVIADVAGLQAALDAAGTPSITNGLDLPAQTPTVPAVDKLRLYGKKLAGRMVAAYKTSLELDRLLQQYLGDGQTAWWIGNIGTTTLSTLGASTATTTGTATNGNVALTSKVQSISAVEFLQTAATTSNVASFRYTAASWVRGNNIGGGFFAHFRAGPATGCSNTSMRFFMGMRQATGAPTDVNPSTTIHCLGFGWDDADANCQIFTNDGTGTATKLDLGSLWPVPTTDRSVYYDLFIFAPPNTSSVFITVVNLVTNETYTGEFSADIPPQTTYLAPTVYASVGGVSAVVGIRFSSCLLQTLS